MAASKVIPFESAPEVFRKIRRKGKQIVHSHGVFDLINPGHVNHLEEARALGDVLVVTINSDDYVDKGPGRPYFKQDLRAKSLAALACVDFVVIVPRTGAVDAIDAIRAQIYCKGKDYENPEKDILGKLSEEINAVRELGGEVRFVGASMFSSTSILNRFFDHLPVGVRAFCRNLSSKYSRKDFLDAVESFNNLRILLIGDIIFDRYSYVRVQGLTSKNQIISGRFLRQETHCGGALAVYRHLKEFVRDVKFVSLVGRENWVEPMLHEYVLPDDDRILRDEGFTTVLKERFVEPVSAGQEISKLFSVNFINSEAASQDLQDRIGSRIRGEIRSADAVLLLDFGHGLSQEPIRRMIQDEAPFLALNCQTNSYNHGFNIISRQYERADAFTLDAQELMLSVGSRDLRFDQELATLKKNFGARYAWLTRGEVETIGQDPVASSCFCPPLETEIADTVGAGDAFFSVAALAAVRGLPIDLATFLGQLAGGQAVRIVGNSRPISKRTLINSGLSLLNF